MPILFAIFLGIMLVWYVGRSRSQ